MSYDFGEYDEVTENLKSFLQRNGFSDLDRLLNLVPVHESKILIVDGVEYERLNVRKIPHREINADAIFTKLPNVPVACKPADCAVVVFSFRSTLSKFPASVKATVEEWIGVVHVGIQDFSMDLLGDVKIFLNENFREIIDMKVCVSPFLKKYQIKHKSSKMYSKYIKLLEDLIQKCDSGECIDLHSSISKQIKILWENANIDFSGTDTWESAEKGKSFSHSYSYFHSEVKNGRFIVCGEIAG